MNRKLAVLAAVLVVSLLAAVALPGTGQVANALSAEPGRGGRGGRGGGGPSSWEPVPGAAPAGTLTQAEVDGLLYMREEEKLAHDVYVALGEQWDMAVFEKIARSEQRHSDAVLSLLQRYDVDDPAAVHEAGGFENAELQALYAQLVAEGSRSPADALQAGGAIEEIDILDLEERMAQTNRADIRRVYENLLRGSRDHLRSFVLALEAETGETYEPQYLSQEAYEVIVNGSTERGGGNAGGSGNGGGNRGGGRGRNR